MNFRLDDDQLALQETIARFCQTHFGFGRAAAFEDKPLDRALWRELAGLGVFGVLLPEAEGGAGLGAVEAAVAVEQLGAHVAPGPVIWTLLASTVVDGASTGESVVSGLDLAIEPGATVDVPWGDDLDELILLTPAGVFAAAAGDLEALARLTPLDPLTPMTRFVTVDNGRAAVQILGGMGFTWEMPTNYLLKRALVLDHDFGTADEHALRLSDMIAAHS